MIEIPVKLRATFVESLLRSPRPWIISLAVTALGAYCAHAAGSYVDALPSNGAPPLTDIIHNWIPPLDFNFLVTYYNVAFVTAIITYMALFDHKKLPLALFCAGAFHIIRAIFLVSTQLPVPDPRIDDTWFFSGPNMMYMGTKDLFPSGHTGALLAFILHVKKNLWIRFVAFICLGLVASGVILMHVHYTIDVLGAIVMAYAVYTFSDRHLKTLLLPEF